MTHDPTQSLAIVGLAGRFPSAPDSERFWRLLAGRGDAIRPVPPDRWDATAQLDPELTVQSVGGFLEDVDQFDATFFGISPREAEVVDPQHRLMLETAWRALEDAGVPAAALAGTRTGVYVGSSWHDYELLRMERGAPPTQHTAFGNAMDMTAARVSYFLKLTGPSLAVETGCSSSLVALHLACQALRQGEIDGALVGGVNLILSPEGSIGLTHFGGLSPTGRCRAFAAEADGFVRGEGVAAVYVKSLVRAVEDGDRIRGVIVGTAVNNDGGGESIVTPDPSSQEELLRDVYAAAGVRPDEVAYIEAHGTGTGRGDPIEATAVGRALGQARGAERGPLPIGSVKTNIGHLEPAAGMAGLFKTLLSLEKGVVPPSLHADNLNPEIPFDDLNVRVLREPMELPGDRPVYMGVNSFGWGGTNAHVIVASPPRTAGAASTAAGPVLLAVSAQREGTLPQRASDLRDAVTASLPATAGTLAWHRDHFPARLAVVADDPDTARERLDGFAGNPDGETPGVVSGKARPVGRTAFVFPGQGSQWPGMGRDLYRNDPAFAAVIDRCAAALAPHVDWDLTEVLTGEAGEEWLSRVDIVQPTLWAVSVALAEVWREAGVEPDVVLGHSQGELGAATVAGILSYEDAAMVVARRSRIVRRASGRGRMLAVDLDVEGAEAALAGFEDVVSLAVNNGPRSCVLSGDGDAVLALKELLEADGVYCRLVNVDYASHSPQMDELRDEMLAELEPVRPVVGRTPLMSTVRSATVPGLELDARYWVENLRRPVMFADAMTRLFDEDVTHVVEISAHPILAHAIGELAGSRDDPPRVLTSLRRRHGSPEDMALALARGYVSGLEPFGRLPRGARASVPGYPFQPQKHWVGRSRRPRGRSELAFDLVPSVGERDVWEGPLELGRDSTPWLKDHQVHDAVVVPGAAMMALAFRAGSARSGASPRTLTGVRFVSDLTLGDDPARLSVTWREDVAGGGGFTLSSLAEGTTEWTTHAVARVLHAAHGEPAAPFPAHLLKLDPEKPEEFYGRCAGRGLNYGSAFQGLERLYHSGNEAIGEVVLPRSCHAGAKPHGLHPALWDAALQVALALYEGDDAAVPRSVERVRLHQDPDEPVLTVWSHAVRRGADRIDYHLFDGDRRLLMSIEGLIMERLPGASGGPDDERRAFRLQFVEEAEAPVAEPSGTWSVRTAERDVPAPPRLTEALTAHGADLRPGTDGAENVVFVAPSGGDLAAQRRGLMALTGLVRECLERTTPPRLFVVTANAQSRGPADVPDPGAALYWGYGRVLRREHPELWPTLLDVDPGEPDWESACAAAVLAGDDEDQVVVRDGRRLTGRLVRGAEPAEAEDEDDDKPGWLRSDPAFRLVPDRPGLWEGLTFRSLRAPAPGPGEVALAVTATSLNFLDVMKAMGTYPDPRGGTLLGTECAGVVTSVGPGVTGLQAGDRVVACAMPALASRVTVRADHTRRIPDGLTDAEAAALPMVMATAWYGLMDVARLRRGETVLIHSAAGGLGLAAVQVARLAGAEVIATAGTEEKRRYLRALGIDRVFDSRDLGWADAVRATTGGLGVDVVLNSLTGAAIPLGVDLLAGNGRFVEVGKKDVYAGRTLNLDAFKKGVGFSTVDVAALMNDHPERFAELLRAVWERVEAGELAPLPLTVRPVTEAPEALREMSRGNHIGKFVVVTDTHDGRPDEVPPTAPDPMTGGRFRDDATYLVTGGLGALGLSLAEFLADSGAGALALLGRSAPSAEAAARLAAIRGKGVQVETFRVDVADRAALEATLTLIRAGMPELRGVVHTAGLLDDATVVNLKPEQLERVLAPKVDGSRNLDALTASDPLDLFVLFSSAAALLGNAGQAAYAAGNAFMDALAEARRRRGLPALSVQWGPFTEIGLAAQEGNRGARLAERGMDGFTAEEAWPALVRHIRADRQVVSYLRLNLRQWFESYPDTAALPSWSTLRDAANTGAEGASAGEFLDRLRAGAESERAELLETKVRELASRVLRMEAAAIESDAPFKGMGLDSLMSLEFRNRLESTFGLRLSPTLLWTYGNVRALSGALSTRLFETADAGPTGHED